MPQPTVLFANATLYIINGIPTTMRVGGQIIIIHPTTARCISNTQQDKSNLATIFSITLNLPTTTLLTTFTYWPIKNTTVGGLWTRTENYLKLNKYNQKDPLQFTKDTIDK